jgi:hypothetical protein
MSKLTTQFVEKIRPNPSRRLEIPDSLLPGLYLVVQPSGAKSWAVRYRHSGRTRKYTLDSVARLPLGAARDRAREALNAVSAGRDPAIERKRASQNRRSRLGPKRCGQLPGPTRSPKLESPICGRSRTVIQAPRVVALG